MRTTLDLDADLLAAAKAALGTNSKTHTIEVALQMAIAQAARHRLAALRGTMPSARAPRRRRPARTARRPA
ncbi:MAG: type II toxin-antitoxin system VapB family antitoxin [Planctomycetes bacterium]|nr:type II toxin-antitoxin system VapB family antitoxin [Planctomycetota bacterium]